MKSRMEKDYIIPNETPSEALKFFFFEFEDKVGIHHVVYDFPVFGKRDLDLASKSRDKLVKALKDRGYCVRLMGLDKFKIKNLKDDQVIFLDLSLTSKSLKKKLVSALNLVREALFRRCDGRCQLIIYDPESMIGDYAHDLNTWLPIGHDLKAMFT